MHCLQIERHGCFISTFRCINRTFIIENIRTLVFVHFSILGKLERGIHDEALLIPNPEPNILKSTKTGI